MYGQDDPKKCSAARLVKFNLATSVKKIKPNTIVLNPFAKQFLFRSDATMVSGIVAIDCSWNKIDGTFPNNLPGIARKLPPLLAGNPINYSKIGKLSTAESLAGALFILGFEGESKKLMEKFAWGHTFLELNQNLLKDYSKINSEDELINLMSEYNLPLI